MVPAASLRSGSIWDGFASGVLDTGSAGGIAGAVVAACTAVSTVAPINVRRSASAGGDASRGGRAPGGDGEPDEANAFTCGVPSDGVGRYRTACACGGPAIGAGSASAA